MNLVIAEKPSVAWDIARVLRCARGEGFFESADYRVTWALGHLVTLQEPDEVDPKYKKWRMEDLPILPEKLPTKVISKTRQQFSLVKKLMLDQAVDRLICATDAGREGELIFRLIYEKAGCKKPVERLWINSLTDAAIREGFDHLKPSAAYDGLFRSALCRAQADWLVGMNASRAFTLKHNALLSVGRVQTPTLKILVDRLLEIREFVPLTYHTLTADFGDYKGLWFDPDVKDERINHRIPDKAKADAINKAVTGKEAQVTKAETEPKRELPPQLFDLTSLQRDANRLLGFTAAKTLKTAQALYESRKCLTYPRTDSRYLPNDMIPRVHQTLKALPDAYQPLASAIPKKDGKLLYSKRIFDNTKVSDHHAILPTGQTPDLTAFTPDERALYDLVARRLIAAFYPAFEYLQTSVVTQAQEHVFKSSGRVVTNPGWKQVYAAQTKEDEAASLPSLKKGDKRTVLQAAVKQETTKPPSPHSDASLLSRMERPDMRLDDEALQETLKNNGLGTPATRAAIIERLVQVGYAARRGKAIEATEKGEKLIRVVPEDIASPVLTGRWEQALEEIARGDRDAARFMEGIRRLAAFLVEFAQKEGAKVAFPPETRRKSGGARAVRTLRVLEGLKCPLCGKAVSENDKAFGCSAWKEGCHFTLWKNALMRAKGPLLNEAITRLLLTDGEARGGSGTVLLQNGQLQFVPNGQTTPALSVPVSYVKKENNGDDAPQKAAAPKKAASNRRQK